MCVQKRRNKKKESGGDLQTRQGVLYLVYSAISITFWSHPESDLL